MHKDDLSTKDFILLLITWIGSDPVLFLLTLLPLVFLIAGVVESCKYSSCVESIHNKSETSFSCSPGAKIKEVGDKIICECSRY